MKKIILLLLSFLCFVTACTPKKEPYIETQVEQTHTYYISINYPVTNISKIDNQIKKEINTKIQNFKANANQITLTGKSELSIDYTLKETHNQYLSIALTTSKTTPDTTIDIYTINYEKKNKKIITLEDLIPKEKLETLITPLKMKLITEYKSELHLDTLDHIFTLELLEKSPFLITEESIILYFPKNTLGNSKRTITLTIPLSTTNIEETPNFKKEIETIQIKPKVKTLDPSKKTVALTFDDGPSNYTKEILNILKSYNMNATFFILGNKVEFYQDLLKETLANGNELGNHSYNHKCLTKLSKEEWLEQLNQTNKIVKEQLNYDITLFRPTYGAYNNKLKASTNLEMILWTVDTKDWKYKNSNTIVERTMPTIKDGSIILMHDTHKQTVAAFKKIAEKLDKDGYQVVTVSELKTIQKIRNEQKLQ